MGGTPDGTQLLATVARDAIELLTGPFADRISSCAAGDFHLIYVDTARRGSTGSTSCIRLPPPSTGPPTSAHVDGIDDVSMG